MEDLKREEITHQCPNCEFTNLKETIVVDNFDYGVGEEAVKLTASIPVISCNDCGESFTDFRAEEIKHTVIKNTVMKVLK